MSAAVVITTLVPLGLGAKTPSLSERDSRDYMPKHLVAHEAVARHGLQSRSESEVVYWHRLAQKRLRLLGKRERRIVVLLKKLAGRPGSEGHRARGAVSGTPRNIICSVFGSYCPQALRVAECESGLNVYARNGQYWGLFQFGSYARARYGFAWNAWTQSRAAYHYFRDAGWGPWECRP